LVHAKQGDKFIGELSVDDKVGQHVNCSPDHPKAAATHKDAEDKKSVTLSWFGPEGVNAADVKFPFTVVEVKEKFWQHV
jgi:hypothetical protein